MPELGGMRPDRLLEVRPWNRWSTSRWSCRRMTFLCRRWLNSWRTSSSSSISRSSVSSSVLWPSRLSICPRATPRTSGREPFALRCWEPQLAEQLVEVLTIVSVSSLRAHVEQNEDIPVPRGRGKLVGRRGLQGFS